MQSHKGDTSGKFRRDRRRSATGPDLYLLGRIYSILGIRPRHTGLPGQAFCTARWDHWFIPSHLSSFACLHHFLSLNRKATCPRTSYLPSSSTVLRTVCPFECLLEASLQYLRNPPSSRRTSRRNPLKPRTARPLLR